MNRIILATTITISLVSCSKIEETVNQTVTSAKEKAEQQTTELVKQTVNEQLTKLVNAETVTFRSVFPNDHDSLIENESGRKVAFPNGTPFYVFKYKTDNKDLLLKTLVEQPTIDEAQSKNEFEKVNGGSIIEKITFFEKFLPKNTIDVGFLNDIKNDKGVEYYKIKRFPNASTLIYNPKNQMVYHFVEVKK